jgi:hypothetical protein
MYKRFIEGLKKEGFEYDDIKDNYKYIGGDTGSHLNYFKHFNIDNIAKKNKCICGHGIIENCYISNGTNVIVVGNCCIKKFVPKCNRTCERCGNDHKSIKTNICKECKEAEKKRIYIENTKECILCTKRHKSKNRTCSKCTTEIDYYIQELNSYTRDIMQQELNERMQLFIYYQFTCNEDMLKEIRNWCNVSNSKVIINDKYSIAIFGDFTLNLITLEPTKNSLRQYDITNILNKYRCVKNIVVHSMNIN